MNVEFDDDMLHILDLALAKYRDHLLLGLDMTQFAKGHVLRRQTAQLLWQTRRVQLRLGMYSATPRWFRTRPRRAISE